MLLGRTAAAMLTLVLVLFALERYQSAAVAGLAVFLSVTPGLVLSPIAGALLDRHGRARLVMLDYFSAALVIALLSALAAADRLPVPLLLLLVAATSLTQPLSQVGMRTLFPIIVPPPLWERANAIDSNGYVVSSVVAPALAGTLVATVGGPAALGATAGLYAIAALATIGLRDPGGRAPAGRLFADAWAGVVYVVTHPTLRGLALSVSTANIGWGLYFIALPVLLLDRLGQSPALVGQLFALLGLAGSLSVLFFGRVPSLGRERPLLAGGMLGIGASILLVLLVPHPLAIAVAMLGIGLATGPYDVVLFTLRQRRTDTAWLGRAFAVSMYLNYLGVPVGSALAGAAVPLSLEGTFLAAAALTVVAAVFTFVAIPAREERALV